jgi:hypothetical protein
MQHERPTFQDAELTIKLYDLRREVVLRSSRETMSGKFWPRTYEEFLAVTKAEHEWNAAYRQFSSYWEMVYGMARHGIAHPEYLAENHTEGFFFFAKIKPFLERFRKEVSPTAFQNVEWMVTHTQEGKRRLELMERRVHARLQSM